MIHKKIMQKLKIRDVSQNRFEQFIKSLIDTENGKMPRYAVFVFKENDTFMALLPALCDYVWATITL